MSRSNVIDGVSEKDRYRGPTNIKEGVHQAKALRRKALNKDRRTTQDESFSEAEFQHSEQDEQKINGHGAGDSRQIHLKTGNQQGNGQVTHELSGTGRGPVGPTIGEYACPAESDRGNKGASTATHCAPRLRLVRHEKNPNSFGRKGP